MNRSVTLEQLLYGIAFGLAVGVRFLNLGAAPLSDFEAGWALQSFYGATGQPVQVGAHPGYFSLTTLVFLLLGSNNSLARFWPALVGCGVVLAPFGFRHLLGRRAALIMAFGLSLDPGMVALSRLAGGPMMAIGFGSLALVALLNRKSVLTGIFGGLALISGPSVFTGLIGLLATTVGAKLFGFSDLAFNPDPNTSLSSSPQSNLRKGLVSGVVSILVVSTLFFAFPNGLGAWGASVASYFRGWFTPSQIPAIQPILALVSYQPLAFVFALAGSFRRWRWDIATRWMALWLFMVVILSLIYPGRQVYDIAWGILPLWAMAAVELSRYLKVPQTWTAAIGQAGVVFILCILFWLVSLNIVPGNLSWLILVVVPVLIVLTTTFVGLGWSWEASLAGSVWGFSGAIALYTLAAMFGASQVRPNNPSEWWTPAPGTIQAGLLVETVNDLAVIRNGHVDFIDLVSLVDRPSLKWALRKYSDVRYVSALDPNTLPSVIITPEDGSDLSQTMAYRGQDFAWASYPGWSGALPPQMWKWITTRQSPSHEESLVLWARSDFFPEQHLEGQVDPLSGPNGEGEWSSDGTIE